MSEYHQSIEDGIITINEAKRLLRETVALQQAADMKMTLRKKPLARMKQIDPVLTDRGSKYAVTGSVAKTKADVGRVKAIKTFEKICQGDP